MEPDYKWLVDYLSKEASRLGKVERTAVKALEEAVGNVAKFEHLIHLETVRDEDYKRSKRIAEKVVEHNKIVLDSVSPTLDKLTAQIVLLSERIV